MRSDSINPEDTSSSALPDLSSSSSSSSPSASSEPRPLDRESKQSLLPVRSLSVEFENIKMSLTFDALTVYRKYEDVVGSGREAEADAEGRIEIGLGSLKGKISEEKHAASYFAMREALEGNEVLEDEDDHPLFHQDEFSRETIHTHVRFPHLLRRDQLETTILPIMLENGLLSAQEAQALLALYDQRYQKCREVLDVALSVPPAPGALPRELESKIPVLALEGVAGDAEAIIQLIKRCKTNDVVLDLHAYLLSEKFDYLRKGKEGYRGTDAKDQIVETTKIWADIQQAISLQLRVNVINSLSATTQTEAGPVYFTLFKPGSRAASIYDEKFQKMCPFYSLQRKISDSPEPYDPASASPTPAARAFAKGDQWGFFKLHPDLANEVQKRELERWQREQEREQRRREVQRRRSG